MSWNMASLSFRQERKGNKSLHLEYQRKGKRIRVDPRSEPPHQQPEAMRPGDGGMKRDAPRSARRCPIREWTHLPVFYCDIDVMVYGVGAKRVLGTNEEEASAESTLDGNWCSFPVPTWKTAPWALLTTETFSSVRALASPFCPQTTHNFLQRILFPAGKIIMLSVAYITQAKDWETFQVLIINVHRFLCLFPLF